uniref:ATP synthase peripheral stalk subunit OSCP, mitochondrial n=1 Tax=Ailuropoda melanoleuca TaxID=9646 RepID=A0A7N5P315_AILME
MAAPAVSGLSRQVRCFSTSVVRPFSKLVRPPVQVYGIEGRYATALYSAASKQNKLEQVEKELLRVAKSVTLHRCPELPLELPLDDAAEKDKKPEKLHSPQPRMLFVCQILKEPKMAASIMNPYIKRSVKVKSLNDMSAKERFSPLTSNLINLLAENGRLDNTPGVISAFSTIMSVHRGEVPCTVTTASPLDEATLTELKTVLKSFLSKGQVLKLEVKTDPSIMGGMIVRIGERYADMSAKTKIQKLSRAMREVF